VEVSSRRLRARPPKLVGALYAISLERSSGRWCPRPELIPNAVEELLRWTPLPTNSGALPRYALADVQLSGGTVAAGDAVLLAKHIAHRDPREYEDPNRLDVTRQLKGHVMFGHGPHHCLGAQLARMDLMACRSCAAIAEGRAEAARHQRHRISFASWRLAVEGCWCAAHLLR
jgi:cytochrome P450